MGWLRGAEGSRGKHQGGKELDGYHDGKIKG